MYRIVEKYGHGPYSCFFCGRKIKKKDLLIHHVDGNHRNHAMENIEPAHRGCHTQHHLNAKPRTSEHQKAINAGHRAGRTGSVRSELNKELWEDPKYRKAKSAAAKDQWAEGGSLREAQRAGKFKRK